MEPGLVEWSLRDPGSSRELVERDIVICVPLSGVVVIGPRFECGVGILLQVTLTISFQ